MEESGSTFNKVNEQSGISFHYYNSFHYNSSHYNCSTTAAPRSPSTTTHVTAVNPSIEDVDDLVSGPVEFDFLEEEGSDYSTEDSVESECGLVGDDDEDYGSDVHEEVKELRDGKRSFQRRKRKERVPADTEEVLVGESGADLGFDETQIDVNELRRAVSKYVVQKRVQIEKCVNEPKRVRWSTCVVKLGEPDALGRPVFQTFYICFDPLKKTFQNCRKCISLDGCFLKGVCRGQLLVVVAKDGNNQMLPLAWAVVEYEKKGTWTWFIKLLKEVLGLGDGEDLTLITDMQKGLIGAILNILPVAEHRMCARHILANWVESQLRKNVAKMKLLGPEKMMDDLMYYNIEHWSRHKTIITMLDEIRVKMMTRIAKLREFTNTWMCDFSPMSLKVLQENIDKLMNCNIEFNGVNGFEVREGPFQHSVDLGSKTTYLRTYANILQPVTNMEMWHVSTNPTVAPPEIKSMPGRPGKLRKKEAGESKKSGKLPRTGLAMTCSNCNARGHNKRGCPQRVKSSAREEPSNTDKGKTSGLGRPKKAQTEGKHFTKRSRGRPPAALSASPGPAKWSR
ncbi:hypothetical protein MTR67_000633 [Solanum verrucosum]|uniref:CCHC-type domain-containing protein n=1 Tax=Solanum verrucosum TaxID=315347 RepID=A0AAF0PM05_SOLVR|nr:hypothetical protein MTR67_000633 [Solanum verrucosum]